MDYYDYENPICSPPKCCQLKLADNEELSFTDYKDNNHKRKISNCWYLKKCIAELALKYAGNFSANEMPSYIKQFLFSDEFFDADYISFNFIICITPKNNIPPLALIPLDSNLIRKIKDYLRLYGTKESIPLPEELDEKFNPPWLALDH